MNPAGGKQPGDLRLGALIVLALVAVLLYTLDTRPGGPASGGGEQISPATRAEVYAIVDTMLNRYGISRSSVRTWNVLSLDKKPIRTAQQIEVPRGFPSLVFNAQMQRMLEPIEAHVFATERSKDNTVTMHIVWHRQTIRSLAFSLTQKEE